MVFPPGTILQRMYLKERLRDITPGKFVEVGVGHGWLSKLLCQYGWHGIGFDLNEDTLEVAAKTTRTHIQQKQYRLINDNWLHTNFDEKVDLVISSMVIEHLNESDECKYFDKCRSILNDGGKAILFVPASILHWGIEDIIAGHYRRYSHESLHMLMKKLDWRLLKIAGLTYPVSNILYPLSEWIIKKSESKKLMLSVQKRTEISGNRYVMFKTTFPVLLQVLLNEVVMYPFHLLQKMNVSNPKCLVIYLECAPKI